MTQKAAAGLSFHEANDYETHGELLTRIWSEILDDPDPTHVISELDFVAYDTFVPEMAALLFQLPAVFVPYCTRDLDGNLRERPQRTGAWLLGVNNSSGGLRHRLRLDWLAAGGEQNDAANMALRNALEDGAVAPGDYALLDYHDEWPEFAGLEYQSLGFHCFFHRHFDDPPATPLFPGYTLGQHLEQIVKRLDALEQK